MSDIPGKVAWKMDVHEIMRVNLAGAQAVQSAAESGLLLLTRNVYGKSHVLVTTPYFMLLRDSETAHPLIEALLADLQREVLPVQVAGDVQFLMNKISPAHRKVVLNNNKGIIKPANGPVTHDLRYAADVSLTAPAGTVAEEILHGKPLNVTNVQDRTVITLQVPPGEIRVVDVKMK